MTLVPLGPDEGIVTLLDRYQGTFSRETSLLYWFRKACDAARCSLCLRVDVRPSWWEEPLFAPQPGTRACSKGP